MAKITLHIDDTEKEHFGEAAMIGIVTSLPAYRLCWVLNNHFEISFVRDLLQNILLKDEKGQEHCFPTYKYNIPNSEHMYLLHQLKNGTAHLLPKTRQLNYLWLVQTGQPEPEAKDIIAKLRSIPDIQLAQLLDAAQFGKSMRNLIV